MGVYIIAEAGVNHNGDINLAKKLVDIAKKAGCDCVKFQTFSADKIVTKQAEKAEYQKVNTKNNNSQYEMLKKLELSYEEFNELKKYCDEVEIDFLSTPFDEEATDLLEKIGVNAYKIPSGEITNKPLLQYIAKKNKKMFVSTGMCTLEEVQKAVTWLRDVGNEDIVLFHCTSNYPASYETVNMEAMLTLKREFGYPIGYSDHTKGIEISLMSVAYGATVVEKHFTYDRHADGPDHKASLEPDELIRMVEAIRHIESARGNGEKKPTEAELSTRNVARKSLVWSRQMAIGDIVKKDDIQCKRPGTGIEPEHLEALIGCKTIKVCNVDMLVQWDDFDGDRE